MLAGNEADLIFVTPADPVRDVQENQHAQMEVIHRKSIPWSKCLSLPWSGLMSKRSIA